MKKNILFCLLSMLFILSCSEKGHDSKVQLVDGVISFLEKEGFTCDTTTNVVTNEKEICLSQKELYLHYYPEHNVTWDNEEAALPLRELEPTFYEKVVNLVDSIKTYVTQFTSLEPNRSFPDPETYGFRWMYDSLRCELYIGSLISSCDNIQMRIAITNDLMNANDNVEYDTNSQDQCILLLKKLYEDYVFYDDLEDTRKDEPQPFETVVDDFFTKHGKQKLIDAYADEYDGEIESGGQVGYAIWALRTSAQDSDDKNAAQVGLKEVLPLGNNQYAVKYYDMGIESEAVITFAEEDGKLKIDDFKSDSKSYDLGR